MSSTKLEDILTEIAKLQKLEKSMLRQKAYYEKNIKSGFPIGRPRKGEIRPVTVSGIKSIRRRQANPELIREQNRLWAIKYRAEHPEKYKLNQQNYRKRKKLWDTLHQPNTVTEQILDLQDEVKDLSPAFIA